MRTVVITGASSGIGRATALEFARLQDGLVLVARRGEVLDEVARECAALGSRVLTVAMDVTDSAGMRAVAEEAVKKFGVVDVWVNNAGTGAVGEFTQTPPEAHEQVIRVNLLGCVHGAHAILPHFRSRARGILINVNSIGAWVPAPYAASYSASKFGLRGLSEALRGELWRYPHIHVCEVFPSCVDTPGFQHGGNYTGHELKPAPPVYDPAEVARAIVSLADHPREELCVGFPAAVGKAVHAVAPRLLRRAMAMVMERGTQSGAPVPCTDGHLFQTGPEGTGIRGGYRAPLARQVGGLALLMGAGLALRRAYARRR